jgi:4'-phosphopantetheinyl transferase
MTPQNAQLLTQILPVGLPSRVPLSDAMLTTNADPCMTVEAWKIAPECVDEPLEHLLAPLDASERNRLRNMRTVTSQRTYAISRACLRHILATKIGGDPREIVFTRLRNSHGKPILANPQHGLTFNLSHAHGLIAIALGHEREIGIDVEWLGRRVNDVSLSRRYFTEAELAQLVHGPRGERVRAFLKLWTRREAHAKMTGEGLRRVLADGTGSEGPFGGTRSSIFDLELGPNHVGALAVQKTHCVFPEPPSPLGRLA